MKWYVWKRLALGDTNQTIISERVGCSKQYVNRVCGELIAQGILTKAKKNRVEVLDKRKLLFKLAVNWRVPDPAIINLPLKTRDEMGEYFRKEGINYAFTLKGLSAWVDKLDKLKKYQGKKGFRVYGNQLIVLDKKENEEVDDVQLFCDYFSKGGLGIDLALSHGLKAKLL